MRLGVCGWGRFGMALGELARESGYEVAATDPTSPPPAEIDAGSIEALAAASDILVLAVPVPRLEAALHRLVPAIEPRTLVLDVSSVKVEPTALMDRILGDRASWVGTHPLFGPDSMVRGDPRTVVVCPNDRHPGASARARALYERLGCRVVEESAEAHDRRMAETHAIAFFLAKAMFDARFPIDEPAVPPSYQALATVVRAVRSDAGHLFGAIERQNPFAPAARRRLIDALEALHHALADPADPQVEDAIPDLGARSPALLETRTLIEELDHELVDLLARRAALARRAGQAKSELKVGVLDPRREHELLERRRAWAVERGLDPSRVEDIFRAVLRFSRRVQES